MALLNIEGDLSGLREIQINFIRDVLEKRGFTDNKVVFEAVGKSGDNYASNVKRIIVFVNDEENFKMIVKIAPEEVIMRQIINTAVLFNNETVMYEEILPKLASLQKQADVPEEDILKYAKCYGCLTEEPNELILLEDLQELNLVMLDRLSSLSDRAVKLILKNFAILHSLSFALKKLEPETYDRFKSKLIDMWSLSTATKELQYQLTLMEDAAKSIVDESYRNFFNGIVSRMPEFYTKMKKTEVYSRNLVILQGDGWTNNIMFKLEDGKPTDCMMIDYQISRESSPVSDVLYMIFNCTDHAIRENCYFDWIDYYHDQLDRSLSNFGIKANYVYPKDQLDADLKRYSKVYFGTSVMLQGMLSRKPEEAEVIRDLMKEYPNTENEDQNFLAAETLSNDTVLLYKSRLEGLVDSYRLFGYL